MAIKMTQSLKQTQNLVMTPQLQQAIKLLTLTHMEMTDMIANELVDNPMLEEVEGSQEGANEADHEQERIEIQGQEASTDSFNEEPLIQKDDFDWNSYIENYNSTTQSSNMAVSDPDEAPNYENIVRTTTSLADHLEWQLRMDGISDDEWAIAEHIIHNIDNNGYLQIDIDELIQTSGQDRESVLEILAKTQRLDPVGCGARDLQECLLIQAQVLDQRSPLLEKVIREHMKDLECKDYDTIAKSIGVKVDRIKEVEHIIQSFHPRPGRLIATEETHYVVPDIFVVEQGGEFVVQVNDDGVPRLRISKLYQDLMKHTKGDAPNEAKDFVQDKLRAALWLIKSIQNRQNTIFKVSKAIVRRQQDFFRRGSEYLKPMILKDIADEIGMHESTVSRVTTNKFMHTPIGLFELKYFFNSGIGGKNGGIDISNEVLKIKLKRLIESEDVRRPFSDQKLAELLSESDVVVARRTVAKYREMLGVASSASRKKKSK